MKPFGLAFLLVGGCAGLLPSAKPDLAEIAKAILDDSSAKDPDHPFVRVEVFPIPGEQDLYVAIEDTWDHWFGTFACFKYREGRFHWFAGISEAPNEQSILEVRGVRLPGFANPFVEVFGTTHMIVEEYSDDARIEIPLRSYPCRKVFLWDPEADRFVEDTSKRKGFQSYGEEDG